MNEDNAQPTGEGTAWPVSEQNAQPTSSYESARSGAYEQVDSVRSGATWIASSAGVSAPSEEATIHPTAIYTQPSAYSPQNGHFGMEQNAGARQYGGSSQYVSAGQYVGGGHYVGTGFAGGHPAGNSAGSEHGLPGYGNFAPVGWAAPSLALAGRAPKPRHRWTHSALAATAVFSLLVGGLIGFGVRDISVPHSSASSENVIPQIPSFPQFPGTQPQGQAQGETVDSGTVVDKAPGVVLINTTLMNGAGAGTGVVIDPSGLVLTNYHVVSSSETVKLTVADTGEEYQAKVLGHDARNDIALLQIEGRGKFDTVTTSTERVKAEAKVYAVGNGSGQGYLTRVDGTVTKLNQTIRAQDSSSASEGETLTGLIETSADVVPGYSGGPLMNSDGKVIGITTAASTGQTSSEVNGYAVPISTALEIAQKIKNGQATEGIVIGRNPALGVMIQNAPGGARVVQVIEGSGAQEAGISKGDIITAVDGKQVSDASGLSSLILGHSVGDTVTLSVTTESGTTKNTKVTLGESSVN